MTRTWSLAGTRAIEERTSFSEMARAALYTELPPRGWVGPVCEETGFPPARVSGEIRGDQAITLGTWAAALRQLSEPSLLRALRPVAEYLGVYVAALPGSPRLLGRLEGAVASLYAHLGALGEAAALADRSGTVSREAAAQVRWEAGHVAALLGAIVNTAETSAGARLA